MLNLKPETGFKEWPKIPRGQHENVTITEKIDGTNACIIIEGGEIVGIQSRKRLLVPAIISGDSNTDNFGFARWVMDNDLELVKMGDGYHYGEWAGPGIQKNPHSLVDKQFFLFNVARWGSHNPNTPECCQVVPTLFTGKLTEHIIEETMLGLAAAYNDCVGTPEGVIVYFHKTRRLEEHTFRDQKGKWADDCSK